MFLLLSRGKVENVLGCHQVVERSCIEHDCSGCRHVNSGEWIEVELETLQQSGLVVQPLAKQMIRVESKELEQLTDLNPGARLDDPGEDRDLVDDGLRDGSGRDGASP